MTFLARPDTRRRARRSLGSSLCSVALTPVAITMAAHDATVRNFADWPRYMSSPRMITHQHRRNGKSRPCAGGANTASHFGGGVLAGDSNRPQPVTPVYGRPQLVRLSRDVVPAASRCRPRSGNRCPRPERYSWLYRPLVPREWRRPTRRLNGWSGRLTVRIDGRPQVCNGGRPRTHKELTMVPKLTYVIEFVDD